MALRVLGAGFGRTGTNSLRLALAQLGFGPCHHMFEVRDKPELLAPWQAAARGEALDWDKTFRGYRSQVDWPGARYWRELAAHYPDAKVILSVRPADDWFDSVQKTIAPFIRNRASIGNPHVRALAEMAQALIVEQIFDNRLDDRSHATGIFEDHVAEVQRSIAADRLLTFDVAEGWQPLCEFLGVAVPDTPFPNTNSSESFNRQEK
jgi:hypothetical protein